MDLCSVDSETKKMMFKNEEEKKENGERQIQLSPPIRKKYRTPNNPTESDSTYKPQIKISSIVEDPQEEEDVPPFDSNVYESQKISFVHPIIEKKTRKTKS